MAVTGEYLGMSLVIEDVDKENLAYFSYCAAGEFRLQRGRKSGLLRYPPTTACPWTRDREYDWVPVQGKGTVCTYTEVHHAIQPAFRSHTPYLVLLVELDTHVDAHMLVVSTIENAGFRMVSRYNSPAIAASEFKHFFNYIFRRD